MKDIWFGYWFKNWFFPYKLGYLIVISGIRSYFKNHSYKGKNNIPNNAGIIYAVNHQNAFLDPIVIAGRSRHPTYFLTRADIFKKPIVAKFLSKLYMLPIYRQRDGSNSMKKNEKTFNECYDILAEKGKLIIFPEGNHNYRKSLRPLKKGIARIALGAGEKYDFKIPIYIVPIGLDYENHFNMNGDLFLNAGNPIYVNDYFDKYLNEPAETINELTSMVYESLKKLIININDIDNYTNLYYLIHKLPFKKKLLSVDEKFFYKQSRLYDLQKLNHDNFDEYQSVIKKTSSLIKFCKKEKIRPYLFQKNYTIIGLIFYSLIMLMLMPFHLIGLLTNYIPYILPVIFTENKIEDKHFHGSLKFALGVILFYIYWLLIIIGIYAWKGLEISLISAIFLPLIAVFNFKYWIHIKKLSGALRYTFKKGKNDFISMKKDFDYIYSIIH